MALPRPPFAAAAPALLSALAWLSPAPLVAAEITPLSNASGTLTFALHLEHGAVSYTIDTLDRDGRHAVVETSPLGLTRTDADFAHDLTFVSATDPQAVVDDYSLPTGKQREVHRTGRECTYTFRNATGMTMTLTVRAYADGVAFRYGFPGRSTQLFHVSDEATGFKVPAAARLWAQPYSKVDVWAPAYESDYLNGVPSGTPSPSEAGWALPVLFQTGAHWALITESGLDSTSFAIHLQPTAPGGVYRARLPEEPEAYGVAPRESAFTLPWQSPWRVIVISDRAGGINESTLVTDLAAPSAESDFSWVRPGVASWSWWSDMGSPSNPETLRRFIDAAARFHWPYSLLDSGWQDLPPGELEKLVAYAQARHVGLLLWYNSGGRQNQVPDAGPRDRVNDPLVRDAEFARIAALGIKGIKVDFMQSDKQFVIALYHDILRDAARHHLLVDFHGATIPRGWDRTHPNLVSMEGVRGSEQYWDATFAEQAQTFNSIYVFTRNAVGPMDYTPTILTDPTDTNPKIQHHRTTNAHELALLVVFQSGIQHVVDSATSLAAQPAFVQDYLTGLPAAWDESHVLAGEPGKLAVLARRSGDDWYVSAINGLTSPQSVHVPLAFLPAGRYELRLISDGTTPAKFAFSKRDVSPADAIDLELAGRGGFAARLIRR